MFSKSDYAVVSLKSLVRKNIDFGYRCAGGPMKDSGWRLMYDRYESPLDLANPDKVFTCDIKKLLRYFPELREVLGEKKFTVIEKVNGEYVCRKTDKDLSDVPCRMTGKDKYGAFVGGRQGGHIFTADPSDIKNLTRGKEDWEDLIPEDAVRKD